ncbi:MAG: tetratricopeptide repeat protein [Candidatus Marinimicrobia bacterium]|nr:tetratricopeptide repeat protein [Candidatus Neomarinimicrobiota bacterium]
MLRARKKITKKELKHDAMLEAIYKVETFVKSYSKQVMYGGVGLIAVIVVSVMMLNSKREAEIRADSAVGIAQYKLLTGDFQDAEVRLEDALRKYPGTKSAREGKFYLANAHYLLGNMEDAEKYYLEFLSESSNDPILQSSANSGLAAIKEDSDDHLSAANFYMKASFLSTGTIQSESYMLSSIRNYYKSGDIERAKEMVEDMLADDELSTGTKENAEYWKSVIMGADG